MQEPLTLRELTYRRYSYTKVLASGGGNGETVHKGNLLTFVYDIPYFDACGVFPPLHIANQVFLSGSSGGGMSPGTLWEPFTISEEEYATLADAIRQTPVSGIKMHSRFAILPMQFDPSFDHIQERMVWFGAVCEKHRERWHKRLREAGAM